MEKERMRVDSVTATVIGQDVKKIFVKWSAEGKGI